ncbi:MAG: hypothetical protein ACLUPL_07475 [Butyricimonas virosa]
MKKLKLTDWLFILLGVLLLVQGRGSKELGQLLEKLILGINFIMLPFVWGNDRARKIFAIIMLVLYLSIICIFNCI